MSSKFFIEGWQVRAATTPGRVIAPRIVEDVEMNQECKTNRITCRYCPHTGVDFLLPPLCQQHLDLTIFITYLKRTHQPATTAQLKALVTHYQGEVSIGVNEIEPLLVQISQTTRPA